MEYFVKFRNLCQIETKRYILIVGVIAVAYLMFQSFMLPYGNALRSLLPDNALSVKSRSLSGQLSAELTKEGEIGYPVLVDVVKGDERSDGEIFDGSGNGVEENGRIGQDVEALEGGIQNEPIGLDKHSALGVMDVVEVNRSRLVLDNVGKVEPIMEAAHEVLRNSDLVLNETSSVDSNEDVEGGNKLNTVVPENVNEVQQSELAALRNVSEGMNVPRRRNKVRPGMPPVSVVSLDEMHRRLARYIALSSKMKPQWSSVRDCDKEIIDAKFKIINAPASVLDKELYAPVFRNVSEFIRSYELMEKTLKVFVYKDGKKPIFHQPILKGLYASEGWFMKLMEANKHFVVKNPEKAHLFYMPFSSRMLEYALYIPNSHNRTKLRQFVKGYTESIAAKYPFWNRTGGTDHFVVACHDWALYETRHHMENSIKVLCNADVTIGFKIGRDISLPETFVRYARNPLRDLGGNPPSRRNILAFYAGNSHGYLRPILLKHWKGKDPDMRIYGVLPTGVARKKNYMQHMKSSKYCICPKGFEVNSPRVVEAIFYECVPVIISDNFVPPFFEVLNWQAFSIIVAEKEIPNLKNILLSIPEEKYLAMQLAVRRVQKHFLWHARPVKYDLFHMILHSIWYSRVFQIQRQ